MPNSDISLSRITRENQRFFINSTEIPGIQSVDASYDIGFSPIQYLGMSGPVNGTVRRAQVANFNVNALLISDDLFINYTGSTGFNGYLLTSKDNITNNFGFTSGYLNSYSSSYSIGQIPTVTAGIFAYGNAGKINLLDAANDFNNIQTSSSNLLLKVPGPGSVSLNMDEFLYNRLNYYSIDINCSKTPYYSIGNRNPTTVDINWPIEVICSFQIELDAYEANSFKDFPFNNNLRNLELTVNDFNTNIQIATYQFNNLVLTAESRKASIDGGLTANLQFKTYLNRR